MPGIQEWMVIAVVALIVLGPDRLPQVARTAGRLIARFRSETRNTVDELKRVAEIQDLERELQDLRQELRGTQDEVARSAGLDRSRGAQGGARFGGGGRPGSPAGSAGGRMAPAVRPADSPPPVDPEAT